MRNIILLMFCDCLNTLRIVNLYICFCLPLRACLEPDLPLDHRRRQEEFVLGATKGPPRGHTKRTPPSTDHRGPTIRINTTNPTRTKAAVRDETVMSTVRIPVAGPIPEILHRLEILAAKVRAVTHYIQHTIQLSIAFHFALDKNLCRLSLGTFSTLVVLSVLILKSIKFSRWCSFFACYVWFHHLL